MSGRRAGVPTTSAAFRALTLTFFRRFFDNEITGGSQDLTASFFWLVGFLAAPFALMPVGAMFRYRLIAMTRGPDVLRMASRPDKTFVIALGMMVAALIAAVVWNSLMLERRDGLILGALPVRGRTVVQAKLAALAAYVAGISIAMHAVPSVAYGVILADRTESLRLALLGPVAHFTATVASCAFVFLSVTAAQGLALALSGPSGFRRVSPLLQVALVAAIVIGFTKIPTVVRGVAHFNQPGHPSLPASWLMWMPPAWFLGLYEWILGNPGPAYGRLAATAVIACGVAAAITLATYAVIYRRVMVRVVEAPEDGGGVWQVSVLFEWLTRRLSRRPVRRASAQFFFASVGRVERLRFVVAVTMGVLCAWIVPALAVTMTADGARPSPRTTFALSYAAMLLVLIGLRIAISMPADLRASWIVPMIDAPGRTLRSGLWRALFVTSVVPVVASFAAFHAWLWNARLAIIHSGVMIALGILLVELALWHFDDMSNRRPWRPENANLRFWWPAYLVGFGAITGTIPQLEGWFQDSLVANAVLGGVCLLLALALRLAHGRPYPVPSHDLETFVEPPRVLGLN